MTNLYNREFIDKTLDNLMQKYLQEGICFSIAMLDIDYFKFINDTYGHLYGDEVLIHISNILQENLRPSDYIGRYGGEEFIVLLPDTKNDKAKELLEKIRQNIENFSWKNGNKITISAGVYENGTSIKRECIANADKRLYLAKENGRNRIVF